MPSYLLQQARRFRDRNVRSTCRHDTQRTCSAEKCSIGFSFDSVPQDWACEIHFFASRIYCPICSNLQYQIPLHQRRVTLTTAMLTTLGTHRQDAPSPPCSSVLVPAPPNALTRALNLKLTPWMLSLVKEKRIPSSSFLYVLLLELAELQNQASPFLENGTCRPHCRNRELKLLRYGIHVHQLIGVRKGISTYTPPWNPKTKETSRSREYQFLTGGPRRTGQGMNALRRERQQHGPSKTRPIHACKTTKKTLSCSFTV